MKRALLPLLAVLVGCASADPGPPPMLVTPLMLTPPPVYALLGFRTELGLSSEQVVALDSIGYDAQRRVSALAMELRMHSTDRGRGGPPVFQVMPDGVPLLEEIRQSNREVLQAVQGVLTEQQQGESCRLARQQVENDPRRRPPPRQEVQTQQGRRMVVPADSAQGGMRGRFWPWCPGVGNA